MRIAMVSEHADPLAAVGGVDAGGQNVHVAGLAAALAGLGHEVTVYTRRAAAGDPATIAMAPGVTVEHVPAGPPVPLAKDDLLPHMPAFADHLRRRWRASRPDVAHAHFWMSGVAALEAAEDLGVPVAQTFHALGTVKRRWQGSADTSPPERLAIERDVGRRAAAVIATCSDEVRELTAMDVPVDRITVVPCGVDLGLFHPDEAGTRGEPDVRILSIGRLVPRKGVDTVIEALCHVPGARLVIAGGEPGDEDTPRLRALAAARGLAGRVRLAGAVAREDVPALMRSAQVVVTVPWYEPFGMVPVEAMACGVPVVASAVGGHLDTVSGCGMLVPPRRPRLLAAVLRDLLARPELRAALGASGVRRARSRYGWPRVAAQTESVYRSLIGDRLGRLAAAGG
ncbi:glycosyl transferase [Sphaerisporangium krabiense]|uniref:Glycosyltransferase involved in cell wall biosynthesis n=1 Tax=Sphaerisporangium krabiense TaxID=763782 RepID=A0A7W9DNS4_9ACTN|nr:glycosyltransferase [Sphaerisporangium krabiense]MBB5625658.1 glycosyltransferase involved in cell wall biosynthesis [Sphaerisporangium krabiense]GII63006.1 glycosyl transferase [Sphaerisporangium krabiense]